MDGQAAADAQDRPRELDRLAFGQVVAAGEDRRRPLPDHLAGAERDLLVLFDGQVVARPAPERRRLRALDGERTHGRDQGRGVVSVTKRAIGARFEVVDTGENGLPREVTVCRRNACTPTVR